MEGYWGWRSLVFCMCVMVLVTACVTDTSSPSSTSTEPPPITLTIRNRNSIPPPTATALPQITTQDFISRRTPVHISASPSDTIHTLSQDFGIDADFLQTANPTLDLAELTAGMQIIIPDLSTSIIQLEIRRPHCTLTSTDQLLCIGEVYNPNLHSVENVALNFRLKRTDDTPIEVKTVEMQSRIIYPEEAVPYAIQFETRAPYASLEITPLGANLLSQTIAINRPEIEIIEDSVIITRQRYALNLMLKNNTPRATVNTRLILSVYDNDEQLAGFRTIDIEPIAAFDSLALSLEVLPIKSGLPYHHRITLNTLD